MRPKPKPTVYFLSTDHHGGRRLRSEWPATALRERNWNVPHMEPMAWPLGLKPDSIVLMHRPLSPRFLDMLCAYRAAGIRVVVQEDDDLSCIPALNLYQATTDQLIGHDQAVAEADALVVTSDRLVEVYGKLNPRTYLIPNRLPRWVQGRAMGKSPRDETIRVGWAGVVDVHRQDLEWLRPAVAQMLRGAAFTTIGDQRVLRVLDIQSPAQWLPWEDDAESFYRAMSWADIGIVPLDNGLNWRFNEAKSWLKALEFMSLGRPVVATDLPEQRKLIRHGENGYLAKTPDEFAEYVQRLVQSWPLRLSMGKAALETAREQELEQHVEEWERMLLEVADGPGTQAVQRARVSRPRKRSTVRTP